jgi:hypothetical protein
LISISVDLPGGLRDLDGDRNDRLVDFAKKFTTWRQLEPGALHHNSVIGSFLIMDGVKKTIGNLNYLFLDC